MFFVEGGGGGGGLDTLSTSWLGCSVEKYYSGCCETDGGYSLQHLWKNNFKQKVTGRPIYFKVGLYLTTLMSEIASKNRIPLIVMDIS